MAAPNLTREQAQQRAELLEVRSYQIKLDLTNERGEPSEKIFTSTTTVTFKSRTIGASSWIDLVAAKVHRAVLNGTELDLSGYREEDGIALPNLAEHNELTIEADCRYMNTGEGLHRFVDPVDNKVYLYSQFETADAKRMFACFDQPDLKATFQINVTAPADWKIISNSLAETVEEVGQARKHSFATTKPLPTYVVAVVAGPYAEWRDEYSNGDVTIPLGVYCRASLAEHMDAERVFTETRQGFDFFIKAFGLTYPFTKYDQSFVPEFNAGAMENAACVTHRDQYVFRSRVTHASYERRAETILHELAHMWFGDLVTMRWWNDLWLNESFATWASNLAMAEATEYKQSWTTFANLEKAWALRQDQLPSTHPVAAEIRDLHDVEVNFDGITYAKGASVLKQLVAYVGLDHFLAGLKVYFTKHAWGNSTLADLLSALEEASGRDLSWWSAQWLETTGLNLLRPEFSVDADNKFTEFTVVQGAAKPGAGEYRTHRLAIGIYDDVDGRLVRTHRVELDVAGERTVVSELVGVPRGKLVLVNDDDLTYCMLRLDPESLDVLINRIGDIKEALPRALCWSAAWQMTRDAEFKPRDFVKLVLAGAAVEGEIGVVRTVLMQAQMVLSYYAAPEWQNDGWSVYSAGVLELAKSAEPGSDRQLAFVQALTGIAVVNDQILTLFTQWLAGENVLPGLKLDHDLRWRLLHTLVAHGKAGDPEIDAEYTYDSSATGQQHAETARALIPTAAAKETAWHRATQDDSLPNAINEAIIAGFDHPSQRELIAPYVKRYFDDIADVWQRRSIEVAQNVVLGLFPRLIVDQATVDAAEQWLADEHPAALKRLVSEERSIVERGLRTAAFDRA